MPWLLTLPSGETFTCDAFDAPRDGSIHMLNAATSIGGASVTAQHYVLKSNGAPREFTAERVGP